jgi:hypothetical protein
MADMKKLLFNKDTRKLETLTTPINRLGLDLKRSALQQYIDRLHERLRRCGIRLRPRFYLGEEWGCVEGTANIEIGFWDADPLLKELGKEIQGMYNDVHAINYLLRHETGHAFCYVHRLYQKKEFRSVFGVKGSFFESYPETDRFKTHPWSRNFVNPNRDHYAQKHPDEDFAETFGVWLDPRSNWKRAYRNKKGALYKLRFVGELVQRYGGAAPAAPLDPTDVDSPVENVKDTVAEFLGTPLARYRRRATGYIDPMLRKIGRYRSQPPPTGTILVADMISAHFTFIQKTLVRHTKLTRPQAASLLNKMEARSRALRLHFPMAAADRKLAEIVSLASALAARFVLTGAVLPKKRRG